MRKVFCWGSGVVAMVLVILLGAPLIGTAPAMGLGVLCGWATCRTLKRFLLIHKTDDQHTPSRKLYGILETVPYMDGPTFELFVAATLEQMGYKATVLGGSGDQGVDVIAEKGEDRVAFQCKNYARPIGNKAIQEVFAGMKYHRCNKAAVVAPNGFTKGAKGLAHATEVQLYDRESIQIWIEAVKTQEGRHRDQQA